MIGTTISEIPNGLRGFTETGLDQSRRAFGSFIAAARRNAELMQGATEFARSSTLEMTARSFDYAEQNVHATLDYAQKLARSGDLREAMQVQIEFMRDRFGALQNQAKEIGSLAQARMQQSTEQTKTAVQESPQHFQKIAEQNQEVARKAAEHAAQTVSETVSETANTAAH